MLITQTPLRISLAGGGTDLPEYADKHGGEVLGFSIDKYLFVWIKERFDHKIIINWSKKEVVSNIRKIQHELVREAAVMAGLRDGFEVITTADIPSEGSGLGSSSALTVGLINAFFQYCGAQVSTSELAQRACQIEVEILKKPMGRQDQYLSALGGIRQLRFAKGGHTEAEEVDVSAETLRILNQNLMLYYTGVTRKSSDILRVQVGRMRETLPVHHKIKKQVAQVRKALEGGCPDDLGLILHEGWELKKQLAKAVTNSEIDAMYSMAREAGATGGKVCGAGGGGFLLLYCPIVVQEAVRERLRAYAEVPFQIEVDGSKSIFNARRPMWKTIV